MADFKPFTMKIRIEDPEEADVFLAGCILAESNNNAPQWRLLIDAVNDQMMPYRQQRIQEEVAARGT